MLIINLMIIILFIGSVILLSGARIMFEPKYLQIIMFVPIMFTPFSLMVEGYKLGEIGIEAIILLAMLLLLAFIWGYKRNLHRYSIHNVKKEELVNIIKGYLEGKNIKYEVSEDQVYLPEFDKSVFIDGLLEISLDCREIKDMEFYSEFVEKVRAGIKEIKGRHFSIEGMVDLAFVGGLYWVTNVFLVDFLK